MITRTCGHARSIIIGRNYHRVVDRNLRNHAFRTFCLLADKTWLFGRPDTEVHRIDEANGQARLWIARDDLLHPIVGGNKYRKLDAVIPALVKEGITDVVTCGGQQSAHTAAVAAACAEHGMLAHLLLRGEAPEVPTGYGLMARMYGHVHYISRQEYADRLGMISRYVAQLQQSKPGARIGIINEGAGDAPALLGLIRLVAYLATLPQFQVPESPAAASDADAAVTSVTPAAAASATCTQAACCHKHVDIVIDSGTGTTATGVALGIALLGLPWRVVGIMLAAKEQYYVDQQHKLVSEFLQQYGAELSAQELLRLQRLGLAASEPQVPCTSDTAAAIAAATAAADGVDGGSGGAAAGRSGLPLVWCQRSRPRKFGKVLAGEIAECQRVAREHGILLDPIYTLAAWETSWQLVRSGLDSGVRSDSDAGDGSSNGGCRGAQEASREVVMLHTGGHMGLHGLAQRFPEQFE